MALLQEFDSGTPIRVGAASVRLTIDGREGQRAQGHVGDGGGGAARSRLIPRLCATDNLEAFGSCRLCLVEIEGRKGTPASCTTPAEAGMVVRTQTPRLAKLRRGVMELYISDHPLDCLTCSANGDCELQTQAGVVGLRDVRYGYKGENHLDAPTDSLQSLFHFRVLEEHRLLVRCVMQRLARRCRARSPWTIPRRGFDLRGLRRGNRCSSPPNASPAAPACRPARPRR